MIFCLVTFNFVLQSQTDRRSKRHPPTRQVAQDIDEVPPPPSSSLESLQSIRRGQRSNHHSSNHSNYSVDDELYKEQLILEEELKGLKLNGCNMNLDLIHQSSQASASEPSEVVSKEYSRDPLRTKRGNNILVSDDSLDREVEGLLKELCGSQEIEEKLRNSSTHLNDMEESSFPTKSFKSDTSVFNGASSQVRVCPASISREPEGVFGKRKLRPSKKRSIGNRVSLDNVVGYNPSAIVVTNDQEAAKEFLELRKVETNLREKIKLYRQFLEQKLDDATRQEVEEQYFDTQEELCRLEKTMIYLCSFLTKGQVNWLLRKTQDKTKSFQLVQPEVPIYLQNACPSLLNGSVIEESVMPAHVNQYQNSAKHHWTSKFIAPSEGKTVPNIVVENGELKYSETLGSSLYKRLLNANATASGCGQGFDVDSIIPASSCRSVLSDKQTQTIMNQQTQTEVSFKNGSVDKIDLDSHREVPSAVQSTTCQLPCEKADRDEVIKNDRHFGRLSERPEKKAVEAGESLDTFDAVPGFENQEVFAAFSPFHYD